jgi:farnesyl-diphosphate farnesyltransferase
LDDASLQHDGARFGKGLQMVNILRDIPQDLRKGRCYIPAEDLSRVGLEPARLLDAKTEPAFRPLYQEMLDIASAHLRAGWDYVNALPFGQARVRLACAWPVLLGAATLKKLRAETVLDPTRRVKVTRAEVRQILLGSTLRYPFKGAWNRQFERHLG